MTAAGFLVPWQRALLFCCSLRKRLWKPAVAARRLLKNDPLLLHSDSKCVCCSRVVTAALCRASRAALRRGTSGCSTCCSRRAAHRAFLRVGRLLAAAARSRCLLSSLKSLSFAGAGPCCTAGAAAGRPGCAAVGAPLGFPAARCARREWRCCGASCHRRRRAAVLLRVRQLALRLCGGCPL